MGNNKFNNYYKLDIEVKYSFLIRSIVLHYNKIM